MATIAARNHTGTIKTKVFRWWLEHDVAKQAAADAAMVNRCSISNPFLAKRKNDKTGDIGSEAAFAQWAEPLLNSEAFRREGYKQPKQSTLVARIKNLVEDRIKVLKKGSKTGSNPADQSSLDDICWPIIEFRKASQEEQEKLVD